MPIEGEGLFGKTDPEKIKLVDKSSGLGSDGGAPKIGVMMNFEVMLKALSAKSPHLLAFLKDHSGEVKAPVPKDIVDRIGGDDKVAHWRGQFKEQFERSPGGRLEELADIDEGKYLQMLREEWLCKDPLTGICMGLACEFIINVENEGGIPEMNPTPHARHFERLLIPAILSVCAEEGVTPDQVKSEGLFDKVYQRVAETFKEKAGLNVEFTDRHVELDRLMDVVGRGNVTGHQALTLEDTDEGVASNHTIYFNKELGVIADGASGTVVRVGPDEDFAAVFALYVKDTYGATTFSKFTLAKVSKQAGVSLKKPSMHQRFMLRTQIQAIGIRMAVSRAFNSLISVGAS